MPSNARLVIAICLLAATFSRAEVFFLQFGKVEEIGRASCRERVL